jgi:peptide/nickel transport system permease protein
MSAKMSEATAGFRDELVAPPRGRIRSAGGWLRKFIREKPLASIGLFIFAGMVFLAVFANVVAPYGYRDSSIEERLVRPSADHWFGTDDLGRDLLSRIIYGARVSVFVAVGAVLWGTGMATIFGVVSAYVGGKFDLIFQRITDAWLSIPWLLLMMSVVIMLPDDSPIGGLSAENWGMVRVIIALGIGDMAWASRVIRGAALSVKENTYIEAARALGVPAWRIIGWHIMPNIIAPIIIMATLGLGFAILSEASLSFLGLGVPPPAPSWGGMMQDRARHHFVSAPWLAIFPGLAITIAVFGINMLGDGLRDMLDPRLRGGRGGFGR